MDKTTIDENLKKYFPTAQESQEIVDTVTQFLATEPYLCNPDNTLYGQSVCSDEINYESGDITDLFTLHWGEVIITIFDREVCCIKTK